MLLHINEKFTLGKLNSSSIWGQFSYHLWGIATGNDVTGSREPETGNEREIISRVFLPGISRLFLPGISRVFPGTPLDPRYEQWACESNLYRVTIDLLPPMLNHFPLLICAISRD